MTAPATHPGDATPARAVLWPWVFLTTVWAACTLLLVLFRPGYTFPPFELLDSWLYTSYQWDLRAQIAEFGPTYYGSRLSWILPAAFIHSFLPPVAANLCYKLLASALLALACGSIVYRTRGLFAGMLAVALSVAAPQVIVALHADYTDTPVFVYAALTLACITQAKESRYWPAWIFAAGMCFSGMAIANLSSLAVPGVGLALFHLFWLRWGFGRLALSVLLYIAGAAVVCGMVELVSRHMGAKVFFLKPQVDMLIYMNGLKDQNPWSPKNWQWALLANWLVLPVCTLLCGLFRSLVVPPADATVRPLTRALTLGLAASLGGALVFELRGMGVLSLYYYCSFHLCFALPLLALLCTSSGELGGTEAIWTATTLAVLMGFVLWGKSLAHSKTLFDLFAAFAKSPQTVPLLVAALLLMLALGLFLWRHFARLSFLSFALRGELLLMAIVVCSQFEGFRGVQISDRLRERYAAVHDAAQLITREFPANSFRCWIDGTYRDGISLAATKLWDRRLLTLKVFPEFDEPDLTGRTVIVLAAPGKGVEILGRSREALAARGLELTGPRILPVPGTAGTGFDLVCFKMQLRQAEPAPPANGAAPPGLMLYEIGP